MADSERERIDIAFVRKQVGVPHLSDPDALVAFGDGRGVFDGDPHCRKLDAFIATNKLDAVIESDVLHPVPILKRKNDPSTSVEHAGENVLSLALVR